MKLIIKRFPSTEHGTFGAWCDAEGYPLMSSLERPWLDNIPFKSCIPAGKYQCVRVSTGLKAVHKAGYEETFEVMDVPGRDLIRVHPANWYDELEGCLSTGTRFGYIHGRPAVKSSVAAFKEWMQMLEAETRFELEIIQLEALGQEVIKLDKPAKTYWDRFLKAARDVYAGLDNYKG